MTEQIEGILFDMGGTLRSTVKKSSPETEEAIRGIVELLGVDIPINEFSENLLERAKAYKDWTDQKLVELNEQDLWTQWMLPDWPVERIRPVAVQLNQMFRDSLGIRTILPETQEVVLELYRRGYHLGLVSNTTSSVEVPAVLKEMRLAGCFDVVVLSSVVGKRKPDPSILQDAAERMGISPEKCAYIGNQPIQDVAAARNAGFSKTVILNDPEKQSNLHADDPELFPDHKIGNLKELLDIFPPRKPVQPARQYNVSLSTMWAVNNFPTLPDFFEFARRAGFTRIELNHQVNSAMLAGIDLSLYSFSSIHDPCPADIPMNMLVERDWQVSSLNEECRREGVKAIQRSIDLAHELGASTIVVHAGTTLMDERLEKQLRTLVKAGKQESQEYQEIQALMIRTRAEMSSMGLEAVKKSLLELLHYASPYGIRIALENRFHYREFPSPDELGILLDLAEPEKLGFNFDVGHAQHLSKLGFYAYEIWMKRYSTRIFGVHLHDVRGIDDHFTPGTGDLDFPEIAAYLPKNAFRTCEFKDFNTPEQVKIGLQFLFDHGCLQTI